MPLIIGGGIPGGCAVPGVMASRILRSPREKLATLLVVPFMNCGAKVPVFILICGAFFGEKAALAMFVATLVSWTFALLAARFLRSTVIRGEATPFLMELPPYRLPTLKGLVIHTWERAWQYIKKAGTVILGISIIIWAAMTYPALDEKTASGFEARKAEIQTKVDSASGDEEKASFEAMLADVSAEEAQAALRGSFAGMLGRALEPVSELAGFDWRVNIALIGGFAAKEVIVSSLGTAYSMGDVDAENSEGLGKKLASDPSWSIGTALSVMLFVMFYAPCFVTVVAIAREASPKWALFSVVFNTCVAFVLAAAVYNITRMITG
jgi:ferrous iron transport protein B